MKSYLVNGGKKLKGTIKISGSKNAALPIIAGSILNKKTCKIYNVPNIKDTKICLEILEFLGCKIRRNSDKININARYIRNKNIPEKMMNEMRSTVIVAGALLSRFKEVSFTYPGGCNIGTRPIDLHIKAFKKMGVEIVKVFGIVKCKANKIVGTSINLDFPSVGTTENIIMLAVLAEGKTIISNAAMEPEIVDFANFLNKMGAKIEGAGTGVITITGVKQLKEVSYNIMPDRIETGSFLCAAAATGGEIKLENTNTNCIEAVISKLEECGCVIQKEEKSITLKSPKRLKPIEIKTLPYPGFPTDLQQIFTAMLAKSNGTSIITETIFENRFREIPEMQKMGMKSFIKGNNLIVKGVRKISGARVECTDLRGGAALVILALAAKGKTKIEKIDYILRGYENFDEKLKSLGAKIQYIDE